MGTVRFPIAFALIFIYLNVVDLLTLENPNELQSGWTGENQEEVPPEENCICTYIYRPVCGTDGNTYPNCCVLNCEKRKKPALLPVCISTCENCNATNTIDNWGDSGSREC